MIFLICVIAMIFLIAVIFLIITIKRITKNHIEQKYFCSKNRVNQ